VDWLLARHSQSTHCVRNLMKRLTFKIQREPGFRLNLTDILILLVLTIISFVIYSVTTKGHFFLLPLYIGFTFFLFCNVFRIGNRLEPFWYVPFIGTVIYGLYHMDIFWPVVLWFCEPLKFILILYAMIRRPYRGVFYKQINVWFGQKS
jgi:hypothetical protein